MKIPKIQFGYKFISVFLEFLYVFPEDFLPIKTKINNHMVGY